ncbi:MAG: class II aldolase/adducin family protein [Eubacterium sp.]|jgi:L-fuculose-phosphate aldolase|nr:class II aldolase/adducin family protein [Eubacterium sp.]MCH4047595.1 class II aldolase/adducin family protein [Eubacterium sp.]MCH4078367.1 class II aldolase/adducin family protein [Eubacterium sp.]MCH4109511.1 class II aldolase/adducin family protein [Eubacterium sp.]MCI1306607.1 class II aldolase/adducin family protein [Eubacterium sp.]
MSYTEEEARQLVIGAGRRLLEEGLTARTWGNISARISEDEFIITPSGMAYETLLPEELVRVRIEDCSYEGEIKPSSEKWIHADAYRLRPEVNFIIHTHQPCASAVSVMGQAVPVSDPAAAALLGHSIPCAGYGISSTQKLRHQVEKAVKQYTNRTVFLMKSHGAFILAEDEDEAFHKAQLLEDACQEELRWAGGKEPFFKRFHCHQPYQIPDYGSSFRSGDKMNILENGTAREYRIGDLPEDAGPAARLHEGIYQNDPDLTCILHNQTEDVAAYSAAGITLPPYLDDLAQVAGPDIKCLRLTEIAAGPVIRALRGRNAVLLSYGGALVTGVTKEDAEAVGMILDKACKAAIYDSACSRIPCHALMKADALLQRCFYLNSYSKRIGQADEETDGE